jgi:hypothetical protein
MMKFAEIKLVEKEKNRFIISNKQFSHILKRFLAHLRSTLALLGAGATTDPDQYQRQSVAAASDCRAAEKKEEEKDGKEEEREAAVWLALL